MNIVAWISVMLWTCVVSVGLKSVWVRMVAQKASFHTRSACASKSLLFTSQYMTRQMQKHIYKQKLVKLMSQQRDVQHRLKFISSRMMTKCNGSKLGELHSIMIALGMNCTNAEYRHWLKYPWLQERLQSVRSSNACSSYPWPC